MKWVGHRTWILSSHFPSWLRVVESKMDLWNAAKEEITTEAIGKMKDCSTKEEERKILWKTVTKGIQWKSRRNSKLVLQEMGWSENDESIVTYVLIFNRFSRVLENWNGKEHWLLYGKYNKYCYIRQFWLFSFLFLCVLYSVYWKFFRFQERSMKSKRLLDTKD